VGWEPNVHHAPIHETSGERTNDDGADDDHDGTSSGTRANHGGARSGGRADHGGTCADYGIICTIGARPNDGSHSSNDGGTRPTRTRRCSATECGTRRTSGHRHDSDHATDSVTEPR
jgi:hypothetical protein